jgi:phospholipid/cholesterol/gamma-HCH transport system substrate-binding protein
MSRFSTGKTAKGPRTTWAGAAVIALFASGCAIQPNDNTLPGQVAVGDDGYGVTVVFDEIENLVPNSQVLKDDVVIGTVTSIEVVDWQASVELRLLESVELPVGSVFSIGQKTLLGAQYVEVATTAEGESATSAGGLALATSEGTNAATPGTSLLEDGDVVPVSQTGSYPATEQVLGAVALLLNNGGLSQISTITGELSTALRGRTLDTRSLVRTSNDLLAVLDDNKAEIVRALESLNRLSVGLSLDRERIARAIDTITPGLRALETERNRLVTAITATGRTGTRAVSVIQTSQEALLANLDSLEPILTSLGKVSTELPEALKIAITIPFPAMTTENALRGDYANLFATLDLRGSSLADSFLGIEIPALQALDPVLGPLSAAQDTAESRGPAGDSKPTGSDAEDSSDSRDPESPGGRGSTAPTDEGPCLLLLLGACS